MTIEDDFQNAIDAHPEDWQTRLVFADWLQDRGDERAEGYRALGLLRKNGSNRITEETVVRWLPHEKCTWWSEGTDKRLPSNWFKKLSKYESNTTPTDWYENRRAAEDDAARCFLKLSVKQRAQIVRKKVTSAQSR